jgi:hypothetical protein
VSPQSWCVLSISSNSEIEKVKGHYQLSEELRFGRPGFRGRQKQWRLICWEGTGAVWQMEDKKKYKQYINIHKTWLQNLSTFSCSQRPVKFTPKAESGIVHDLHWWGVLFLELPPLLEQGFSLAPWLLLDLTGLSWRWLEILEKM